MSRENTNHPSFAEERETGSTLCDYPAAPRSHTRPAARLGFLGVAIDGACNAAANADADISAPSAAVQTLVITAREDVEIARQVRAALGLAA